MDDNQIVQLLLRLLEKVSGLEAKMDAGNSKHSELTDRVESIEQRVCALEKEPGKKWNTVTKAILAGIGTFVAGGIVAALVFALK